jgi:hypothetical protein
MGAVFQCRVTARQKAGVIFSAAAAKSGDNSVRFMLQEVESVKNLGTETRALLE